MGDKNRNKEGGSDSSDSEKGEEIDDKEKLKNKKQIKEFGIINEELIFGEQLQDDIINSFCDKLQSVCPKKIDGFLAIQFLACEPENLKKHILGKNEAIQVLYDKSRSHYVVTNYKPKKNQVIIYDSLQAWNGDYPTLAGELCDHIRNLYAHLFSSTSINLMFDRAYERQTDDFSCGYRSIGAIVDIARGENPAGKIYSRSAILAFIQRIIKNPKPTWEHFKNAKIHRGEKPIQPSSQVEMFLVHHSTTSSSSSSTSSVSSTNSILSRKTSTSLESSDIDRRNAGAELRFVESECELLESLKLDNVPTAKCREASKNDEAFRDGDVVDDNNNAPVIKCSPTSLFTTSKGELFGYSTLKKVFMGQTSYMFSSFLSPEQVDSSKKEST